MAKATTTKKAEKQEPKDLAELRIRSFAPDGGGPVQSESQSEKPKDQDRKKKGLPQFPGFVSEKDPRHSLQIQYARRVWERLKQDAALLLALVPSGQLHPHILGVALSIATTHREHAGRPDAGEIAWRAHFPTDDTPDAPAESVQKQAAAFIQAFERDEKVGGPYAPRG